MPTETQPEPQALDALRAAIRLPAGYQLAVISARDALLLEFFAEESAALSATMLREVLRGVRRSRHGDVRIVMQDGRAMQVEVLEKVRAQALEAAERVGR